MSRQHRYRGPTRREEGRITMLGEAAHEWLRRKLHRSTLSPSTVSSYTLIVPTYIIGSWLGDINVREVTWQDVQDWYDELVETVPGQSPIALYLLSAIFHWCEKMRLIRRGTTPVFSIEKMKPPKYERMLNETELVILNETLDGWIHQGFADGIRILLLTGMRRGEAIALDAKHLTIKDGQATARLPTKTGLSTRYLGTKAFNIIKGGLMQRDGSFKKRGKVLPGFTNSTITSQWPAFREATKLAPFRIHDLRHTFVTVGVAAGLPLAVIGAAVGHTQQTTTSLYTHLQDEHKMLVAEKVGEAL